MATEKEALQVKADELGLDTEGTIPQLKAAIETAEAEDGGSVSAPAVTITESPASNLPPAPVGPIVTPKAAPVDDGVVRTYDVTSSFWLRSADGTKLAQVGGTVSLTAVQAKKYLRHNNIKLAA